MAADGGILGLLGGGGFGRDARHGCGGDAVRMRCRIAGISFALVRWSWETPISIQLVI